MKIKPGSSFRKSLALIILFFGAFFAFGAGSLLTVHAQKGEPGGLSSMTSVQSSNGSTIERYAINAPPHPPASFVAESPAFMLPKPGQYSTIKALTVPSYDWVFGCSSVSGAMIAGYYDLNGYPNMYSGPANGGNAPINNSTTYWPVWSDGVSPYPNLPLAASHKGIDGRGADVRGSIDDYWIQYDGTLTQDPYITYSWTPHSRSDAIGDYMGTSQSALPYHNKDGESAFYNYGGAAQLTCSAMETASDPDLGVLLSARDATYGRKLFYEARGYPVTACYNQHTDNIAAGGFSYAQYKAEIDAGRPVMLNLYTYPNGHTVVGVGYDDATNSVIIHDTWIVNDDWVNVNHSMTWGGSYGTYPYEMELSSVSIVNLASTAPPAAFNKAGPGDASTQTRKLVLRWQPSAGVTSYDYCLDDTAGTTCTTSWITTNANTSVAVGPLSLGKHYWQVRAHNNIGDTMANGGTWYSFTAVQAIPLYLPIVGKPIPPPGNFGKASPGNGAPGQSASPTLSWGTSTGAVSYEYCLATSACTPASPWLSVGTSTSVSAGPLNVNTTYYWQVRARNGGGDAYADGGNSWAFTTAPLSGAWTTVMSEDFEGSFPGNTWSLYYENNFAWGKRNCRAYAGANSGWVVGGGSNGASLPCGSHYPGLSDSWMVYGPFDLTDATAAVLSFKGWLNNGNSGPAIDNNDVLCARASLDNDLFYGKCWWGTYDWFSDSLDLSDLGTLGSVLGHNQVWIAFVFRTNRDATTYTEGAYVDNIILHKCMSASCAGVISSNDLGNSDLNSDFSVVTRPK